VGGYRKNRTALVIAFAALSESLVRARNELPLITERVTASGIV
jgi:hypothetical protein